MRRTSALSSIYALTAPSVSARTKYFCNTRNITTTGTLMMNAAAISPGQLVANSVKKCCRPTGSVAVFAVEERQRVDVFVPGADERVDRGGDDARRRERHDDQQNAWKREAPSMRAARSSSSGMLS